MNWLDIVFFSASAVIFAGLAWIGWSPQLRKQFELPRLGRRRAIAMTVMCSTASTLWIGSPAWIEDIPLLPDADMSWRLVGYGLLIPWGVGYVTAQLMEWKIARDLVRRKRHVQPEPVLKGEVLSR